MARCPFVRDQQLSGRCDLRALRAESYSPFASIMSCPLGLAVRWFNIEIGEPGCNEITETVEEAMALCRQFAAGLEIVPWNDGP